MTGTLRQGSTSHNPAPRRQPMGAAGKLHRVRPRGAGDPDSIPASRPDATIQARRLTGIRTPSAYALQCLIQVCNQIVHILHAH